MMLKSPVFWPETIRTTVRLRLHGLHVWPALILLTLALTTAAPVSAEREQARAARQKVLAEQRRVIFNDDTYELRRDDANTATGFLKRRLKPLVGTHVDVISWSVLGGWADAPVYDSKVQPIYGDAHGATVPYWPKVTANVKALIANDRCPLQVVLDFAHGNGMEVFASIRMNDCHDSFIPGGVTLWKKEHPGFLVDRGDVPQDKGAHPLGLYVIAQNFSNAEVRDRKFEIIEEVCQRYDIDGVDLNFMRLPVFFSRTMRGEPVTEEEIEIMTGLIRRIRRCTDKRALERGRPILLAAILPDRLEQSRHLGLDVPKWIDEDLIDIIIPGLGYSPFSTPVDDYVALAHPRGVQVYPCINRKAPQQVPDKFVSEGFRAVATKWYTAGADGIFFWNLGTPFEYQLGDELRRTREVYYAALPELGDPDAVATQDKLYAVDDPPLSYYKHVATPSPLPLVVKPNDKPQQVPLSVADDVQQAAKAGRLKDLRLLVWLDQPTGPDTIGLRMNGQELLRHELGGHGDGTSRFDYLLDPSTVILGDNVLEVSLTDNQSSDDQVVRLVRAYLLVRYRS